jgi:hypothetical protein
MQKINNIKKNGIIGSLLNRSSNTTSTKISNENIVKQNTNRQDQNRRQQGFFGSNNDQNQNFLRQRARLS